MSRRPNAVPTPSMRVVAADVVAQIASTSPTIVIVTPCPDLSSAPGCRSTASRLREGGCRSLARSGAARPPAWRGARDAERDEERRRDREEERVRQSLRGRGDAILSRLRDRTPRDEGRRANPTRPSFRHVVVSPHGRQVKPVVVSSLGEPVLRAPGIAPYRPLRRPNAADGSRLSPPSECARMAALFWLVMSLGEGRPDRDPGGWRRRGPSGLGSEESSYYRQPGSRCAFEWHCNPCLRACSQWWFSQSRSRPARCPSRRVTPDFPDTRSCGLRFAARATWALPRFLGPAPSPRPAPTEAARSRALQTQSACSRRRRPTRARSCRPASSAAAPSRSR